ncbi:RrF2 family transcriptional regulator [Asticcacaulis endophyticus]|uniref:Rrf2 family transcriptional regulator n=1 Tax=Asticcacaulis endophyticus TaxID=1395890 RepID=A0A918Q1U9_9CAUL|nr:Rrf2 family transcriptional regulator [Asticcacaulis endophyticus]GGZ30832.1 hypothetical protein GCM10011273_16620 [Asticcacaulis endophyticus]
MITQRAKTTLRVMQYLAKSHLGPPLRAPEISEQINSPLHFVEFILNLMRRHGFLKSMRGRKGGFILAKPADQIRLQHVIEAVDGKRPSATCTRILPATCVQCVTPEACRLDGIISSALAASRQVYYGFTVADLGLNGLPSGSYDHKTYASDKTG